MKLLPNLSARRWFLTAGCTAIALSASAEWEQVLSLPCTYAHFITSEGIHLASDLREDQKGGISYSEDNGKTWVKADVKDYWFSNFYEADGYLFATGSAGRIARSEDGGRTWDILNYSKAIEEFVDPKAIDGTSCYAITSLDGILYIGDFCGGGILRSENYGETWEHTDRESLLIQVDSPEPIMDNFYNLTAFNGKIYSFGMYSVHSLNQAGGASKWDVEPINSNFMSQVTVMGDKMICGRSVVNFTTDVEYLIYNDGNEWGEIPRPDTDDNNVRAIVSDGNLLVTVHHGGPVYYTTDLGENWEINEDLPSYTYPLTLVADDNYIYTAIYSPLLDDANSGVWRISKAELGVSGINAATAENGVRIEGGYIRTSGNADRIDVYSIAGENVLGASGTDCLSTSSLAPGMYVYRVISGTESFSGKFVNNPSRQ